MREIDVIIRKAEIADLEIINELYTLLGSEKASMTSMIDTFLSFEDNDDYCFLVVEVDKNVIGTGLGVVVKSLSNRCRPFFVIDNIAIDKKHQRQGYGTLLFEKLHEFARSRNCCLAYLVAEESNIGAQKFYEKIEYNDKVVGFQKTL